LTGGTTPPPSRLPNKVGAYTARLACCEFARTGARTAPPTRRTLWKVSS